MSVIQEWLNGPMEYEAGRLLYEQFGRNAVLKRTLSHGPSAYNRSALREELVKLAGAGVVATDVVLRVVSRAGAAVQQLAEQMPAAVDGLASAAGGLIADLEKQWLPLYKDASFLQSQLAGAKDNTERCKMAHTILDKMGAVQELWEASDYVKEHGQLPPVAEVVPPAVLDLTDPMAVLKRRNNLRSQIAKQKRNAERAGEVAAWKEEVDMLDKVLRPTLIKKALAFGISEEVLGKVLKTPEK